MGRLADDPVARDYIVDEQKKVAVSFSLAVAETSKKTSFIPCVYYGSEWATKADKSEGDPALRKCFDEPQWVELCDWISKLAEAKKNSEALNYGSFRQVVLNNKNCIFERKSDNERVLVAINADENEFTAHFDAGCGKAVDLITGEEHDFGGGSVLPPYSAYFWKCI